MKTIKEYIQGLTILAFFGVAYICYWITNGFSRKWKKKYDRKTTSPERLS